GLATPNLFFERVGAALTELTLPNVTDSDSANYTGVVSGGSGLIIPRTGSDISGPFSSTALFAMAAGAFLVIASRRRRTI
ncbi:MAG TPA: LPXTG cell wall anchor domain-containing protein, partial [Ilumatobacter sp.]|nr:LPXTG cell wall anchor domain-containing protein [Ilumatobacter sp.]